MHRGGLILSGGPDSAVAAWTAVQGMQEDIQWQAFHFTYGQMAIPEYQCAQTQANLLQVPLQHIELPEGLLTSTMTARSQLRAADDIEPTFVPGRNALFITMAASSLYYRGDPLVIVGGWNAADAAGYPDCRPGFISAISFALEQALDCPVQIISPVINLMKKDIVHRGISMHVPFEHTWSCYTPRLIEDQGWVPCGDCVSCEFRAKGFLQAGIDDPLEGIAR